MAPHIIPTALGLAVAEAYEEMERERQLLAAIVLIRSHGPIARVDWRQLTGTL